MWGGVLDHYTRAMQPSAQSAPDTAVAMDVARSAAEAATKTLLAMLDEAGRAHAKGDGSLVTEADLASERAIVEILESAPFDAGILTEESGDVSTHACTRWIVDPLDGTHRFTRRHLFWGPLIALEHEGQTIVASMATPRTGDIYWAGQGQGAFCNGQELHASDVSDWRDAVLCIGSLPRLLQSACAPGLTRLMETCEYVCAGGDLVGAANVFSGRAEVWIEAGVKKWDVAPMGLFVSEAGGVATSLTGHALVGDGEAMLISNGYLHEHAMATLLNRPVD